MCPHLVHSGLRLRRCLCDAGTLNPAAELFALLLTCWMPCLNQAIAWELLPANTYDELDGFSSHNVSVQR